MTDLMDGFVGLFAGAASMQYLLSSISIRLRQQRRQLARQLGGETRAPKLFRSQAPTRAIAAANSFCAPSSGLVRSLKLVPVLVFVGRLE